MRAPMRASAAQGVVPVRASASNTTYSNGIYRGLKSCNGHSIATRVDVGRGGLQPEEGGLVLCSRGQRFSAGVEGAGMF